ncbi:hypothetical protein B0H63DRAFT_477943 [Podospora didyma]|uniref:Uncharacterized protein n=1 Tax=Podospora didyma TaxID=330526 RepID=A0AAE0NBM8_9PEZI|nr:hypothetical protein B0H63DRAFT_477943 [Podospora didyma]
MAVLASHLQGTSNLATRQYGDLTALDSENASTKIQLQKVPAPNQVSKWLFDQEQHLIDGTMEDVSKPRSNRGSPPVIIDLSAMDLDDDDEQPGHNDSRERASHRHHKGHPASLYSSQSKGPVWLPLTGARPHKRKHSYGGHRDEEVKIVETLPSDWRRGLYVAPKRRADGHMASPSKKLKQSQVQVQPQPQPQKPRRHHAQLEPVAEEISDVLETIKPNSIFGMIAPEIRDKIYRHLLVSKKPIQVKGLWTELVRCTTRRSDRRRRLAGEMVDADADADNTIDTKILRVCRLTAAEGTRILYSENSFLYLLRDPECCNKMMVSLPIRGMSGRAANTNSMDGVDVGNNGTRSRCTIGSRSRRIARVVESTITHDRTINIHKFGHLFRHMGIELEPNRTGAEYERLMQLALDILANGTENKVFLDTLAITVSPVFEGNRRTVLDENGNEVEVHGGRYLSVVNLFSRGSKVLKALQQIDTNFIRINVHIPPAPAADSASDDGNDSDESDDEEHQDRGGRAKQDGGGRRHLETTLDLRFLSRHLETVRREGPIGELWSNDHLICEHRKALGEAAETALSGLRHRIEKACTATESAITQGLWEDHAVAERRRIQRRARDDAKLDGYNDATDKKKRTRRQRVMMGDDASVENGDMESDDDGMSDQDETNSEDDDNSAGPSWAGRKSLILSIDRVGGQWKAYIP